MAHVFAGEEPAPERAVRDDGRPELARGLEEPDLRVLDVEREGGVLDLERGDGVHGVRAPEGVCGALGEAEVLHFAFSVGDPRGQYGGVSGSSGGEGYLTSWAIASTVFSMGTVGSGLRPNACTHSTLNTPSPIA